MQLRRLFPLPRTSAPPAHRGRSALPARAGPALRRLAALALVALVVPVVQALVVPPTLPAPLANPPAMAEPRRNPPAVAAAGAGAREWRTPLPRQPHVLRPFDPPIERWLPGHRGTDLLAEPGAEIRAAGNGRVAFAGTVAGTGVLSIAHGPLRTTYLPVVPQVEQGRRVTTGEVVATLASRPRHCGPHPCLHWGLRHGRTYLDPLALLGLGTIRLLPGPG
ncbi:hypothetical protein GCM10027570_24080 [Streptomonospora sediminis]